MAATVAKPPVEPPSRIETLACSGVAYQVIDHVCRACGGRVLQAGDTFRCSGCAVVSIKSPAGICGCGIMPGYRTGSARFRCGKNPLRGEQFPAEIVILFGDQVAT